MATANPNTKGRITIPKKVRDVRDLKGMIGKPATPVAVEGMKSAVSRAVSRK